MHQTNQRGTHTFHIPVMGTGFTIDTPLRVAKYGISSVISLVDDILIERMRKFHCEREGEPYEEIGPFDEESRQRRTTEYLNLIHRLVKRQIEAVRAAPFEVGTELTRYFELLPKGNLRARYHKMLGTQDTAEKEQLQNELREEVKPGSIDVNIMSKSDTDVYVRGKKMPPEYTSASTALRGYAYSTLDSSIIFSAGMNPRLYSYCAKFDDFFPDENGRITKHIVLKVSDYRSAFIQGKYFAKRGMWISEYRIESGLNCGGHVFPSMGFVLGPILEQFKEQRQQLFETMLPMYNKALAKKGRPTLDTPPEIRITVQGGIGTAEENQLMLDYYDMDATGWATPFLLVPEVANVDDAHQDKLLRAGDNDVWLSDSSPYGAPFWTLRDSASEEITRRRAIAGKPGSICRNGFIRFDTTYSKIPICAASKTYMRRRLAALEEEDLRPEQKEAVRTSVLAKSCICQELAGPATLKLGIDPDIAPAICCGPNIVNFSKMASLEEMVGHIYGRLSLLTNPSRPHLFLKELNLYVDFLRKEIAQFSLDLSSRTPKYFTEFRKNLHEGIEYYREKVGQIAFDGQERFLQELRAIGEALDEMPAIEEAEVCS